MKFSKEMEEQFKRDINYPKISVKIKEIDPKTIERVNERILLSVKSYDHARNVENVEGDILFRK